MATPTFDRRGFFRQAAVGAAGSTLLARQGEAASRSRFDADVIVIGAGMAGVTAAAALHPRHSVIVLEARPDRIGGRIWTSTEWADEPVDLGASWLSHQEINPLKRLADRAGIQLIASDLTSLYAYEADGGLPLPDNDVGDLELLFAAIYAEVQLIGLQRSLRRLPDIPASRAFETVLARTPLTAEQRRRLNFAINLFIQEPQASKLNDLSLFDLGDDPVTLQAFGTASIIPDGYVQLVNLIGSGLDIRRGHVVRGISYGRSGVAVRLENRTVLRARCAVVTLPLGVLKSKPPLVTFDPPLPRWKQRAIDQLGFGLSNKVYFRFPSTFWPFDRTAVHRIAETAEGRWTSWFNFYKYTGNAGNPGLPTLLSFNHGSFALQLESMTDEEVIDAAFEVIRKQYKDQAQRPIALQRSAWGTDRFARGAVVHTRPGTGDEDLRLLGEPVGGRRGPLFFAGDSTTDDFPGYVLGAYLSGLREARRIRRELA